MAKSQDTFSKKEKEKKRLKKRQEKDEKKKDRKTNKGSGDDMIAYVDEYGSPTSAPPDLTKKKTEINVEDIQIGIPKQSEMEAVDPIRKGKVSFFNDSKGYGFIKEDITQESFFVHVNGLSEPIQENDKVSFEVEMGQKGPVAVNVKKV